MRLYLDASSIIYSIEGRFDGFFARTGLELIEVTSDVIERATELRARHGFRTPDAIHRERRRCERGGLLDRRP